MTLVHRLRRWIDCRCLSAEHVIRAEESRRRREQIAREHEYLAARLEAIQAEISGGVRARLKIFRHPAPTDLIPFPWRMTR